MSGDQTVPMRSLIAFIALFVLIGTPLVAYLWDTLNVLFAGYVVATRLLLAVPALLAFVGLGWLVARQVRHWEAQRGRPDTQP